MFGWPAVCLVLFVRLPVERAAIWSLLGGYMLLPSALEVNAPFLPPLDKMAVTSMATLILCWIKGTQVPRPRRSALIYLFAFGFVATPIFTSLGNSYELQTAGRSIPGFYPLDGLKFAMRNILSLIPLYIGSRFLSTDHARLLLLKAFPTAVVFYSLPMLVEVRLSPQFHRWVYGYFPHSFLQQVRDGGFRPVVFFSHGLTLALFTCLALIAAIVLFRIGSRILRFHAAGVAAYLSGLLVVCKSFGPLIYAIGLAPLILLLKPRTWVRVACVASLMVCAYPLLRHNGVAPVQLVSEAAYMISPARGMSFGTRVENETQLLAKANQKPLFGWGGWGRNLIYEQWTGRNISITDGGWIITFGTSGWLGYLSLFGLLTVAMFRSLRATEKQVTPGSLTRGALTLILAVYVMDQVPNASPVWVMFLLAGCISSSPPVRRRVRPLSRSAYGNAAPTMEPALR